VIKDTLGVDGWRSEFKIEEEIQKFLDVRALQVAHGNYINLL